MNDLISLEKLPLIVATLERAYPDAPVVQTATMDDWKITASLYNQAVKNGVKLKDHFIACQTDLGKEFLFFAEIMATIEKDCYSPEKLN